MNDSQLPPVTGEFRTDGPYSNEPAKPLTYADMPYDSEALNRRIRQIQPTEPWRERRAPAFLDYPGDSVSFTISSGINRRELNLGFQARSIVVQNVGSNEVLYCPEIGLYLTASVTPYAVFNLAEGISKVSFDWHTAVFNPVTPVAIAGEYAQVTCYSEWIPPVSAGGGGGGGGGSTGATTATRNRIAAVGTSNFTVLAANTARKGATIYNDSDKPFYLALGGPTSGSVYTVLLDSNASGIGAYYEVPAEYNGIISGIWLDATASGYIQVTELM